MATARPTVYNLASGEDLYAGPAAPAPTWPAWRTALAPWQWYEIPGTSWANTVPSPKPTGTAANRINAWNGIAVLGTKVVAAGVGGHDDWWGNEAYVQDLGVAFPGPPVIVKAPTLAAYYLSDTDYFAVEPDGKQRPTSGHTYYSLHGDAVRNKVFRLGVAAGSGSGNYASRNVDAFDYTANDWDAPNTWPDALDDIGPSMPQAQHPLTGDVYVVGASTLMKWERATATWSSVTTTWPTVGGPSGGAGTGATGRAMVVDTLRNRLVILGNAYDAPVGAMHRSLDGGAWTVVYLSGAKAALLATSGGNCGHYDAGLDKYLVRRAWATSDGATTLGGGEMLQVDPVTFEVSDLATTGGDSIPAVHSGVWGLLQPMPALGGYVFIPRGEDTSGVCFLASS